MPVLRCIVTTPFFTNVPSDVATNTLHFYSDGVTSPADVAGYMTGRLELFYNACFSTNFLSPIVSTHRTFTWYDLTQPTPRVPIFIGSEPVTGKGMAGTVQEACCVLSFQGVQIPGLPQARRRGRIYLGPLSTTAIDAATASTYTEIDDTFATQIAAAALEYLVDTEDAGIDWVVWSTVDQASVPVNNGWVDLSVDTQRRRDVVSPARMLFAAP